MRQRLGIAAAMLGDPPVLMLDEPFNGMDPEGIVWMRGFLRSLAAQGRAVLVSSHLMSELQDTADHLVVVGRGKVIADTSVADLLAAASGRPGHAAHGARPARRWRCWRAPGPPSPRPGPGELTVSGLAAEQVSPCWARAPCRSLRSRRTARAWKQAYLELTRDAVEFRAELADGGGARATGLSSGRPTMTRDRQPRPTAGRTPDSASCCERSGPSSGPSAAG